MLPQLILGLLLGILVAGLAWRAGSLSRSGAVAAAVEGMLIFGLGGLPGAVLLLVFFVSSSALSRLFKGRKSRFEEKFSKGSRRDAGQVLANGGLAAFFMLLSGLFPGQVWPWIGFAASLAAVNADTWATELGVLSPAAPRLITSGRVVEPGTSGAISLAGSLAGLAGAALIAGLAALLWLPATGAAVQPLPFFAIISLCGLLGALIDSFLGATIQAIYFCPSCAKETERHPLHLCGTQTRPLRGWAWLNNDWVNVACALFAAALALLAWQLLPGAFNASLRAEPGGAQGGTVMSFPISSTSFDEGGRIPPRYTCDGENRSPALTWRDLPPGTRSLALITHDPDAPGGSFVHWVLYNLPPSLKKLPEGLPADPALDGVGSQGPNDFRTTGYAGPCPPSGPAHRYYFTLYALGIEPTLPGGLNAAELRKAMQGHILAESQWVGRYER